MKAIGFDIGKESLFACVAIPGTKPSAWPVVQFQYKDPDWYEKLLQLVKVDDLIVCEPTGYNYFLPIVQALRLRPPLPTILHVNHTTTAAMRQAFRSRAKSDEIDAQTLALIAQQVCEGVEVRGLRAYDAEHDAWALALRSTLNESFSLKRQRARLLNQTDALAHGVWPELARRRDTYISAIRYGLVQPEEMRNAPEDIDGRARRWIRALGESIPPGVEANRFQVAALQERVGLISFLTVRIEQLDATIAELLTHEPYAATARAWMLVRGVGADLAAACFIATHGRPAEYSLSEFKAAVGVAPTTGRSGSVDKTRKKRGGYAPARALIHLAVQTMSDDSQSLIYEYFARHRGKKKRAFAASKRKLAGILSGIARSVAAGAAPEEAAAGVWRRPDLEEEQAS